MAKNINSSKGSAKSGMNGPIRSPIAGNLATDHLTLNPSIAVNTTRGGIAKASAPIQSPQNGGKITRYSR